MKIVPLKIKNEKEAKKIMSSLGVTPEGIRILSPKSIFAGFKIEGISSWEANIIKQQLLSLGSDAALNRDCLVKKVKTDIFIFGNLSQLRKLSDKLKKQPFSLSEIAGQLAEQIGNLFKSAGVFKARDKLLRITQPVICGIINVTADSFSGDGLLRWPGNSQKKIADLALTKAEAMIRSGAKILDLGAESSRPFSKPVEEKEEMSRIIPVIKAVRKKFPKVMISVDTYKYAVAYAAVGEGADIINDITALRGADKMASLVKKYKLGCILMHMKSLPATMQINPKYKDVIGDIIDFFKERINFCEQRGINTERILLDPGIGFGKRQEDNLRILNELYKFKIFGRPLFLGLSRKSFIGKILNVGEYDRLAGTIAASVAAIERGADILRVHDVEETKQACKVACKIFNN